MKLASAASKFDNTTAADAYTPATTFLCQYDPLAYAKIDGVAIRKRSISTAPSVTMPPRGVITIDSVQYLVGDPAPDFWRGAVIRNNYVIQGCDGLAGITTIDAELASTAKTDAYASLVFAKYSTDQRESSEYQPQYQVFLSQSESLTTNGLILLNAKWFMVKEAYLSQSGLLIGLVNELKEPTFETISFKARTYVPATDTWTEITTSVKILRVKWTEHFRFLTKTSENYERGDLQVFVLKSAATPNVSDNLVLSDGTWTVLSIQDEGLSWSLHVRRA